MNSDNGAPTSVPVTGETLLDSAPAESPVVVDVPVMGRTGVEGGRQLDLFPSLKTRVIKGASTLDKLLEGFRTFRGVSFGVSPTVVLDLLEKFGYQHVEFILGESLTDGGRDQFSKDRPILERLLALLEEGRVRILVPKGRTVIHTKLYLLGDGGGRTRVIITSSNLTRTGLGGKQVNYAVYADLSPQDPFLADVEKDLERHRELCEPFLGDLMDLVRKEGDRGKAIEAWLAASAPAADLEEKKIVAGIFARALDQLESGPSPAVTLELPATGELTKQLRKALIEPANGRMLDDRTYEFNAATLVDHLQKTVSGMPLLRVDSASRRAIIWSNGRRFERSAPPAATPAVHAALDHLERYVDTVRFGATSEPAMARTALWEALLSLLSAPFAHEEMKLIRKRYSTGVVSRGPSAICIHGPSHNGKTTLLRFGLRLIAGFSVDPLPAKDFRPGKIRAYTTFGNLFPLIFDDITNKEVGGLETILKSYWEQGGWNPEIPHPQLVITTNREAFKAWAKTRMKKLAFDIQYDRSTQGTRALSALFEEPNDVFLWFSHLYLESLAADACDTLEDVLARARQVFTRLYEIAGRTVPGDFPTLPFERMFDQEKRRWTDLLRLEKARVLRRKSEVCVEFDERFESYEIGQFFQMLPQGVKATRHANLIKIENPREFEAWIGKQYMPKGIISRVFAKLFAGG